MSTDIPPMPDLQTGEPRPPKAPIYKPSNEPSQPWHSRKVPQPPQGEGPPLEWNYSDARTYRWAFGIVVVLMMLFLSGKNLLNPSEPLWFTQWWGWAIVLAGAGFVTLFGRTIRVSAGADWLMDRKMYVKTYELVSVTMEKDWQEGEVHFRDQRGIQVGLGLGTLRTNEALWDLVYNGIRHSVAGGAQVNRMAVERLSLYDVLSMREQNRFDQRAE